MICISIRIFLFVMTLLVGEPGHVFAQPTTVAETRMMTDRVKQEIAQEEKAWTEETAREKESQAKRKQRYEDFNQDKLRLQTSIAEQEKKLKDLLARMNTHQWRGKELQGSFGQLNLEVAVATRKLRGTLATGLPYRLEKRLEVLDVLVRDIEGETISPEEAMNRLWVVYQNERRLAQEAEIYSGDFNPEEGGEPLQVKYLRVGRQILAFSSLDGSKLGILKPHGQNQYAWVREKDMDYATRQALKQAIATAEGTAIPGFVPVPVWKSAFSAGESK